MIVTGREDWARRARYLTTQAKDDPIEYIHHTIGYNYRLTNVLAALGVAQLERLEEFVAIKRRIACSYAEGFRSAAGIRPMPHAAWAESVFWLYTVLVDEAEFGCGSRTLLRYLAEHRIQSRPLWQPLHRSPAHAGALCLGGTVADRLHRDALSLPCSTGLAPTEQARVIDAVLAAGAQACAALPHRSAAHG
jgi:perosamine synthetase